jgi:hypothetical protein
MMEVGRNEDRVRFGVGEGLRDDNRGSRMMGILGPNVSIRRVSRGEGAIIYQMNKYMEYRKNERGTYKMIT